MRLSEFWALMDQQFGSAYAQMVAGTHRIHALHDHTVTSAIDDEVPLRVIWNALCDDFDVPEQRRFIADHKSSRPATP